MVIKLENGGRLRLPSSAVEALGLREGALLECRVERKTVLLTPAELCGADDFPPG